MVSNSAGPLRPCQQFRDAAAVTASGCAAGYRNGGSSATLCALALQCSAALPCWQLRQVTQICCSVNKFVLLWLHLLVPAVCQRVLPAQQS